MPTFTVSTLSRRAAAACLFATLTLAPAAFAQNTAAKRAPALTEAKPETVGRLLTASNFRACAMPSNLRVGSCVETLTNRSSGV